LPNFKEYRTQMVTSEDPEYIFETFNTVLEKFSGMEIL